MKKYRKYFEGNNIIPAILFYPGIALAIFGAINYILGNVYGGSIFLITGGFMIFLKTEIQPSDKLIDEAVNKAYNGYLEKNIKDRVIGKETLNPSDFSVFSGFIRNSGEVRFKAGRDKKIRTSRFYVTAISAEKNECKIFTTVYDLLSEEVPVDRMISTKGADSVEITKEEAEFPKGNYKCNLKVQRNGETEELEFYIPVDDALADKLTDMIKIV